MGKTLHIDWVQRAQVVVICIVHTYLQWDVCMYVHMIIVDATYSPRWPHARRCVRIHDRPHSGVMNDDCVSTVLVGEYKRVSLRLEAHI